MSKSYLKNSQQTGNLLIINGHLFDPIENVDLSNGYVIVADGVVRDYGSGNALIPPDFVVLDASGCFVCPGFTDIHVHLRQPGGEHKGTIESETIAALAGGFTHVLAMPNTSPCPDSSENYEIIESLLEKYASCRVSVCAAASMGRMGKNLSDVKELIDLGVTVFSDDGDCLEDEKLAYTLLKISKETGITFSDHCEIKALSCKNPINEGTVSLKLGVSGQIESSETVAAAKGIMLSYETGGHYHIQHVSSAKTIDLVRWAKSKNINITCEVTPHHLMLDETAVQSFGNAAKCAPPLRCDSDRVALLRALEDGIIDYIATDHAPHDTQSKSLPLEQASFGIAAIETAVPLLLRLVEEGSISMKTLVSSLTRGRKLLNYGCGFKPGMAGDFTIIDPNKKFFFSGNKFSMGGNNPFAGSYFKGCVKFTIINGIVRYEFTDY